MLTASEGFKQANKANVRECLAKLVLEYDTPVTLYRDSIQSVSTVQEAKKEIGSLQDDVITVKLLRTALTDDQFNKKIKAEIFIGFVVNDDEEYVSLGTFKTSDWKRDDYTITIEFISDIENKKIDTLTIMHNALLSAFIQKSVSDMLGLPIAIGTGIVDSTLSDAYLYYKTVKEQLQAFAIATNGLIRSRNGLELVPFRFSEPVDTLDEGPGQLILNKDGNNIDYLMDKKRVSVIRRRFLKEDDTCIFSMSNVLVTDEAIPIEFNYSSPSILSYISFQKYSYWSSMRYGLWGGSISLHSGYVGENARVSMSIYGSRILCNEIDSKDDENVTYISNPYIQNRDQVNHINTDIYKGSNYSLRYRGNPLYQVGDTLNIEGVGKMLITKHTLQYNGSLSGTIEGVLKND